MNKQTVEKIALAYKELLNIPVKGTDTVRMAKALSWLESAHAELTQELKENEVKEENLMRREVGYLDSK